MLSLSERDKSNAFYLYFIHFFLLFAVVRLPSSRKAEKEVVPVPMSHSFYVKFS